MFTALETKMKGLTLQFFQQALINEEQKRVMLMIMDVLMLCPEVDQLCQPKFVTICRVVLRQWQMTNPVHGGVTCVEKDIRSVTVQIEKATERVVDSGASKQYDMAQSLQGY